MTLEFPDSVQTSNFLIFDALSHTADHVIERLTTSLAVVGGDEVRQLGFAKTEQERLKYAWELCVVFRFNAIILERSARRLQLSITMMAFATVRSTLRMILWRFRFNRFARELSQC